MNTNEYIDNKVDDNNLDANLIADEQVARAAANLLNDRAQHLNAVTLKRLSVSRNLAVNQLAVRQTQAAQGVNHSGNILYWLGHGLEQHRMLSIAMIVGAILLVFFAIQLNLDSNFGFDYNLEHSDALLLASELPPEAFADKGFDTWLVSKQD